MEALIFLGWLLFSRALIVASAQSLLPCELIVLILLPWFQVDAEPPLLQQAITYCRSQVNAIQRAKTQVRTSYHTTSCMCACFIGYPWLGPQHCEVFYSREIYSAIHVPDRIRVTLVT